MHAYRHSFQNKKIKNIANIKWIITLKLYLILKSKKLPQRKKAFTNKK